MSMKYSIYGLILLLAGLRSLYAQATAPDTLVSMPRLEIPEITIVGKKAITLPFARKGEIYDVNLYQAPPPDSSILGDRLATAMPIGLMPTDEEKRVPLHAAAEGKFGNNATGDIRAYLDYNKGRWNFFGNGGYVSTSGHTDNAKSSGFDLSANATTLFSTDNNVLKTLQLQLGTALLTEKYGMMALADLERSRQDFSLDASLHSLDRRATTIDLGIATNFWSVSDDSSASERKVTAIAPVLTSAFALTLGKVRWTTDLLFHSISLDYSRPTQSVTLFTVSSSVNWMLSPFWSATGGILFSNGGDVEGGSKTLALPTLTLEYLAGDHQSFYFSWNPAMTLTSYDAWVRANPYLIGELDLSPERMPVSAGVGYKTDQSTVQVDAGLWYSQYSNKAVVLAENNRIALGYVKANQTRLETRIVIHPVPAVRLNVGGSIQPSYADGSTNQLPMIPLVKMTTGLEYTFPKPFTLRASIDYWSSQNIDLQATRSLDGVALINVGASTTLVPRMALSATVKNLLGTAYYWWEGYKAPGIQFFLEAKVNLK